MTDNTDTFLDRRTTRPGTICDHLATSGRFVCDLPAGHDGPHTANVTGKARNTFYRYSTNATWTDQDRTPVVETEQIPHDNPGLTIEEIGEFLNGVTR